MTDPILECHACQTQCHIEECVEKINGDRIYYLCQECDKSWSTKLVQKGWAFFRSKLAPKQSGGHPRYE